VIVSKNFENENVKRKIHKALENFLKVTSTYVVMEFKRRVLKDLMYLHSILLEEQSVGDAQRRLANISRSKRQLKMCFFIFAKIADMSNQDRDMVLLRLENMIRLFESLYLHDVKIYESGTKCELVNRKPIKTDVGSYDFSPPWSCTRRILQCYIEDFLKQNHRQIKSLSACLPKDSAWKNHTRLLKKILGDTSFARGNNCMTLGDTIIALDAPDNAVIYSTNKKDFGPICRCLNRKFNPL